MFNGSYFGARYFAPRYFAKVGAVGAAITMAIQKTRRAYAHARSYM
jgi:hypothetical protein